MKSRLTWTHTRGQYVTTERASTGIGEAVAKYLVLALAIWFPVRIFHWDIWIPFAGASLYLLWELARVDAALSELANMWNEQYRARQEAERDEHYRSRQKRRDEQ